MSEEVVLTYFEGRGLEELIRLTLYMAKIPVNYFIVYFVIRTKELYIQTLRIVWNNIYSSCYKFPIVRKDLAYASVTKLNLRLATFSRPSVILQ